MLFDKDPKELEKAYNEDIVVLNHDTLDVIRENEVHAINNRGTKEFTVTKQSIASVEEQGFLELLSTTWA